MHVIMVLTYGEPKKGYLNFTLGNLWATSVALLIWPPLLLGHVHIQNFIKTNCCVLILINFAEPLPWYDLLQTDQLTSEHDIDDYMAQVSPLLPTVVNSVSDLIPF